RTDPANPATTISADAPWTFWGFNKETNPSGAGGNQQFNGSWDAVLSLVTVFLEQSGLTYPALLDLLDTYFLNPPIANGRALNVQSTDRSAPATCDINKLQIGGLSPDRLKLIHRFVRLTRKLGWSARNLDRTLTALNVTDLGAPLLLCQLAH